MKPDRQTHPMHEYDANFYAFLNSFAVRSAKAIVPVVKGALPVSSVADFGCGCGAWLSVWRETGADIIGVDGDYVDRRWLLIPPETFRPADLAYSVDLGRRFDLVQSLEAAEHLPATAAGNFIHTLTRHSDAVLFSAAVPGQGGENHLNEQYPEYWRLLFGMEGYKPFDLVRPAVRGNEAVQRWYRYNTILYLRAERLGNLSPAVRQFLVPDDKPIADNWPLADRLRQAMVRALPRRVVDRLARINAATAARKAKRQSFAGSR